MPRYRATLLSAIICTSITLLTMLWPGDAPWGGDDVTLLNHAIDANRHHQLATVGLGGSFGYNYGPMPTQFYQLLALFTHNPITLIRLHAGFFTATTAAALLYLATALELSPLLVPLILLSPFFWFYGRLLWDNPFAMPLGVLFLAAYLHLQRHPTRTNFITTITCGITLPLIHPMCLPLVGAVAAAILRFPLSVFRERVRVRMISNVESLGSSNSPSPRLRGEGARLLKQSWPHVTIILAILLYLNAPYLIQMSHALTQPAPHWPPHPDALTHTRALLFPLLGPRLFSAYGFYDARGPELGLEQNPLAIAARCCTLLAYPLIYLGLWTILRRRSPLTLICLLTLLLQSTLDAALRISPFPHYYLGTWPVLVTLLWLGLHSLQRFKLFQFTAITYAIALLISTAAFVLDIHHHHGGTVWYGPSISAQLHR